MTKIKFEYCHIINHDNKPGRDLEFQLEGFSETECRILLNKFKEIIQLCEKDGRTEEK